MGKRKCRGRTTSKLYRGVVRRHNPGKGAPAVFVEDARERCLGLLQIDVQPLGHLGRYRMGTLGGDQQVDLECPRRFAERRNPITAVRRE